MKTILWNKNENKTKARKQSIYDSVVLANAWERRNVVCDNAQSGKWNDITFKLYAVDLQCELVAKIKGM